MVSETRLKASARGGRVLVVDDDSVVRDVLARVLRMGGYDVVVASDGEEAIAMYRSLWGAVDLVLLDMIMPGMDGYDTFRQLRTIRADVRVVLCSGYADPVRVERALAEGVLGFFGKPFTASELLKMVAASVGPKPACAPPAPSRAGAGGNR